MLLIKNFQPDGTIRLTYWIFSALLFVRLCRRPLSFAAHLTSIILFQQATEEDTMMITMTGATADTAVATVAEDTEDTTITMAETVVAEDTVCTVDGMAVAMVDTVVDTAVGVTMITTGR